MLELDPVKHVYRWNGVVVPGVTQIIGANGLTCYDFVDPELMRITSEFGKEVHRVCELFDKGTLAIGTVDPLIMPYLEAWQEFRNVYQPTIISNEVCLYSQRFGFAGTVDRIIDLPNRHGRVVLDLKTPKSAQKSWQIQIAGYELLAVENDLLPKESRRRARWTLQLMPESNPPYKVIRHDDANDGPDFLHALGMYRCKQRLNLLKGE